MPFVNFNNLPLIQSTDIINSTNRNLLMFTSDQNKANQIDYKQLATAILEQQDIAIKNKQLYWAIGANSTYNSSNYPNVRLGRVGSSPSVTLGFVVAKDANNTDYNTVVDANGNFLPGFLRTGGYKIRSMVSRPLSAISSSTTFANLSGSITPGTTYMLASSTYAISSQATAFMFIPTGTGLRANLYTVAPAFSTYSNNSVRVLLYGYNSSTASASSSQLGARGYLVQLSST